MTEEQKRTLWALLARCSVHEALAQVAGYCHTRKVADRQAGAWARLGRDIDRILAEGTPE